MMAEKFSDCNGKVYMISLTLGLVREIRSRYPLDIFNYGDWSELMDSLASRLAFIWWAVAKQAGEDGVTLEQFEENLYGSGVADKASDALMRELVNFYQKLDQTKFMTLTSEILKAGKAERKLVKSNSFPMEVKQAILKSGATSLPLPPKPESTGDR